MENLSILIQLENQKNELENQGRHFSLRIQSWCQVPKWN